ncbi:phosphoethanolamine transferase [Limnohabitans sp. 103DPR2]|uniref:phosphoethanolamine transferase n=1 Tax=Limnohabitans sp. 103DPR2 TaxID=1678129 RepID=UPI0006DC383C|nr:phosphoethanolamine--lipid A transferase [Limnohabitans sp. 103DPR2]ALK91861.1 Phosphoethanolamine transferase EptA [Limnohabitans sp. 103DPR2]
MTSKHAPTSETHVPSWHPVWVALLGSLWLASVGNYALWQQVHQLPEVTGLRGLAFALGFGVIITSALTAVLSFLNWRGWLKPVLSVFFLSAASGAYFMVSYGIVIDSTMITNVVQTDTKEALDLLNWRMLISLLVLGILPCWVLWKTPLQVLRLRQQIWSNTLTAVVSVVVIVAALLAIFQDFSSIMRNHTQLRYLVNPLNSYYAIGMVAAKPFQRDNKTLLPIGKDAQMATPKPNEKPPLLLLVLGETARMGNFGVNGYERQTTPALAKENIISLKGVMSCGTSTATSVPCMFSHLGKEDFEARKNNYESLIDVLHHAGLAVLWIDNQSGCKGVCERVPQALTKELKHPTLCKDGECFDEIMLNQLDERIQALPAERRAKGVVVVMHQMGSHGPAYYKRVPDAFKKFQPECKSNALQECTREQVVNSFDNTILYTDHFLGQAIQWLKKSEATAASAMLYVSDHGESLGENNLYLHGLPYRVAPDVQKRVPWITWWSPQFEKQLGLSRTCLQNKVQMPLTHDNYFHSVLGLVNVSTEVYQAKLDVHADCRSRS